MQDHACPFLAHISILLSSGVPILQSLHITARTAVNATIEEVTVGAGVARDENFVDPLKVTDVFPRKVSRLVGEGGQSGALDSRLGKITNFY